ncbi:PIN domain-like protein [Schizopora paradoxa]|uniref:PIN domain-like protein n=1 Tax=Schizopora paradoxa TaxID=27342 RepID=A0A0H2SB39_9AGAM|nr:PIN domain-like protein [Schizopora paradoxa]
MGVLGLTPFLQRHCPSVIKILPSRLQALRGKTLVIDGTLITQRLHWSPSPYKYRHVLGWYRLVTEMKENGVSAICVFDGIERSAAKTSEIERRKLQRQVVTARSFIEGQRHLRLRKLSRLLESLRSVSERDRMHASATIHALVNQQGLLQTTSRTDTKSLFDRESPRWLAEDVFKTHAPDESVTLDEEADEENPLELAKCREPEEGDQFSSVTDDFPAYGIGVDDLYPEAPLTTAVPLLELGQDHEFLETCFDGYRPDGELDVHPRTKSDDISVLFYNLYRQYQQSASPRSSLKPGGLIHHQTNTISYQEDADDAIHESKIQHSMTLEEGKLWRTVASAASFPDGDAASKAISELADRSHVLAQSYERRSRPPTTETYRESRAMITAMGIPCVESTGPFEAEGLAASLVLQGRGDYVATEDTDVLVYGAPMVRNLTNQAKPLFLIVGAEVREALQLSQDGFIDFALLLGTDFTRRIRNVGPARALKFIRTHREIESIVTSESQYAPALGIERDVYLAQVGIARGVFKTLPPVPGDLDVRQRGTDTKEVSALLLKFGLGRAVADEKDWDYGAALAGNYFNENIAFS